MRSLTTDQLQSAERFIELSARLVDRLRFAHFFGAGSAEAVVAALMAYRNPDGGFGNALEPDLRDPGSQPGAVLAALRMMEQVDRFPIEIVRPACDYLLTITAPNGGVPFLLPSAMAHPRPPWCATEEDPPGALTFTAPIAALLHKRGVEHPWRDRATEFCWRQVEAFDPSGLAPGWSLERIGTAYEARALLLFLDHVDDRPRAEAAMERIAAEILDNGLVEQRTDASGEVHKPLDYAPSPQSPGRRLFSEAVIEAHLDHLIGEQRPDGGWMFDWTEWSPAATLEWRGWLTVEKLLVLRAYGRLPEGSNA